MIEAITTLPPIVVADLFGLSPSTAETWARCANDSWTHYLAAQTPREGAPHYSNNASTPAGTSLTPALPHDRHAMPSTDGSG